MPVGEWARTITAGPTGAVRAGSVGPNSATVGHPTTAARWVSPESLPTAASHAARRRGGLPQWPGRRRHAGTRRTRQAGRQCLLARPHDHNDCDPHAHQLAGHDLVPLERVLFAVAASGRWQHGHDGGAVAQQPAVAGPHGGEIGRERQEEPVVAGRGNGEREESAIEVVALVARPDDPKRRQAEDCRAATPARQAQRRPDPRQEQLGARRVAGGHRNVEAAAQPTAEAKPCSGWTLDHLEAEQARKRRVAGRQQRPRLATAIRPAEAHEGGKRVDEVPEPVGKVHEQPRGEGTHLRFTHQGGAASWPPTRRPT